MDNSFVSMLTSWGASFAVHPHDIEWWIASAQQASQKAYAPYSRFTVGAAVLCRDSTTGALSVHPGCNVENASYGLTCCAERNALSGMVCRGHPTPIALLLYTPTATPTPPCGACRQFIVELVPPGSAFEVFCVCDSDEYLRIPLQQLLPCHFNATALTEASA